MKEIEFNLNVVYLIIWPDRVENEIFPCYYIGSKSNCYYDEDNKKILYKQNNRHKTYEYWGSSRSPTYTEALLENRFAIVLSISDAVKECRENEAFFHRWFDVVADVKFFNRSIAMVNNYDNPEYATYKHSINESEVRRLPRNHEKVLSGEWVGVTKGHVMPEERVQFLRDNFKGENGSFWGKKHTEESIKKMVEGRKIWLDNHPEQREKQSRLATETFKGKKQSPEHVAKRADVHKNIVMLKNKETGEIIRLRNDSAEYFAIDRNIWNTPFQLRTIKTATCEHCGFEGEDCYSFHKWHGENCKHKNGIVENSCIHCGKVVKEMGNLRKHEKICPSNPDYVEQEFECPHCHSISNTLRGFFSFHFDNCRFNPLNDKEGYKCKYCKTEFVTTILLTEHHKTCKRPVFKFHCEYCDATLEIEKNYLQFHGDNCKHKESNRTCIHCGEISKTPYLHNKHHGNNCKYAPI